MKTKTVKNPDTFIDITEMEINKFLQYQVVRRFLKTVKKTVVFSDTIDNKSE